MKRRGIIHTLGVAIALTALSSPASAQLSPTPQFFQANPRGAYLRADGSVGTPLVIDLGPIMGGRHLTLTPNGYLQVAGSSSPWHEAWFCGVFSSSTTLLDQTQLNRVVDAIAPPASVFGTCPSAPTFFSYQPTDILNDFRIPEGGLAVDAPDDARFLFVAVPDDYFADNVSPDPSQYGVYASETTATPEPVTIALLGSGLVGIGGARLRRRKKDSSA